VSLQCLPCAEEDRRKRKEERGGSGVSVSTVQEQMSN